MKNIITISILFACVSGSAQLTLRRADQYYEQLDFQKAAKYYKAFLYKKDDAYSQLQLAKIYKRLNNPELTERWYKEIIHRNDLEAIHYLNYAQSLSALGRYEESLPYYNQYQELADDKLLAKEKTYGIQHLSDFFEDSALATITPMDFNTAEEEFAPTLIGDELIFSSSRGNIFGLERRFSWNDEHFLDLYRVNVQNGEVNKFTKGVNSKFHEGATAFTPDGNTLYFTRNNYVTGRFGRSQSGVNMLKIYTAKRTDKGWKNIRDFEYNSDDYSTGDPTITADGKVLYFISDMPGGYGGTDIYKCTKTESGWSTPINLGHQVNTEGDERSPFLTEEGKLYFSSEGHFGLGGLDIYVANAHQSVYDEVINMGSPINSSRDDFGFIFDPTTRQGYLASNRHGGKGSDDIYAVTLLEDPKVALTGMTYSMTEGQSDNQKLPLSGALIEVVNVTTGKQTSYTSDDQGKFNIGLKPGSKYEVVAKKDNLTPAQSTVDLTVKNQKTIDPMNMTLVKRLPTPTMVEVEGFIQAAGNPTTANLFLLNSATGQVEKLTTNSKGKFNTSLRPTTNYILKSSQDGYLVNCRSFRTGAAARETYQLKETITLEKLEINQTLKVENLLYDLGKWDIKPESAIELDKVVQFMKDNPSITAELGAHTDARGSASFNASLSGKRAKSAMDYVISKGVATNHISSKGYGETLPLNHCKDGIKCTETEYAINRRTEIKITGIKELKNVELSSENAFDSGESYLGCEQIGLIKK